MCIYIPWHPHKCPSRSPIFRSGSGLDDDDVLHQEALPEPPTEVVLPEIGRAPQNGARWNAWGDLLRSGSFEHMIAYIMYTYWTFICYIRIYIYNIICIYIYVYVYIQYIYICIYIYAHVCVCICMHVGRVSWCKNASTLPQHSRFFFLRPVIWQFQQDGKSLKQLSLPTRSSWLPTNSSCSWKLTSCCIYQSEDTWVCPPTHGEDPKMRSLMLSQRMPLKAGYT